ncbi:hypothetical protein O181_079741 [Austropuccinia psidii MF-1]|uniref:Septin-type G domain-containing protein n=1 Tax=Austropuccinia psidii MF-1 TaxID=1389203 RepID=A0A9Q3IE93_9BASI|nr:hypothetical protein [Austropuccinia psidii MF-1]
MFIIKKRSKQSSSRTSQLPSSSSASVMSAPKLSSHSHQTSQFSKASLEDHRNQNLANSPIIGGHRFISHETHSFKSFNIPFADLNQTINSIQISKSPSNHQITRPGLRKSRQTPTFNLMILGAKSSGKSTFLNTLIGTFTPRLPNHHNPTPINIQTTYKLLERTLSIISLSGEKITLKIIDTPGLDIHSNDDLRVDSQINEALRYIENKLDESLHVERQVHRNPTRLGDGHVHLSIYFIDPSTILRPTSSTHLHLDSNPKTHFQIEHMSSIDLKQLKRLNKRTNVLPVIARADELTEDQLIKVKEIVRRDIKEYGIHLGIFDSKNNQASDLEDQSEESEHPEITTASSNSSNSHEENDLVKKLPRRKSMTLPNSRRSRASVMGFIKKELEGASITMPLSIIGAEIVPLNPIDLEGLNQLNQANPFSNPTCLDSFPLSAFVRKFKWATVDILNPNHCDFLLLRAVVLGSHLSKLKEATRLEKYEKFRTEKLLARRITLNNGPTDLLEHQRKIVMEVNQIEIPHIEPPRSIFGDGSLNKLMGSSPSTAGRSTTSLPKSQTRLAYPSRHQGNDFHQFHQINYPQDSLSRQIAS